MKMEWYMINTSFCLLLLLIIHQATTQSSTNTAASTDTTTPKVTSERTTSSVFTSTTTTATTTTTTPVTTTQPPVIGGTCVNNSNCAHLNNAECISNSCQCINGSFSVNSTTCFNVSHLEPQNASLVVDTTFMTLKWNQYSEPVRDLIMNGTLEIVVKVKELPMTNCSVNTSAEYANCTELNLTHGVMYTLDFSIIQVQSNTTVYSMSFSNSVAPGQPGAINKTSEFRAPNISLNWEASPGLVDNYTVTVTEDNENKSVMNTTRFGNSTTIQVNGLRHGRNYTVVIVAKRFDKTSDPRTDYFSTVIMSPEPPINVSVMPGSIGNTSLNLTWTRPVDFNGPPLGYKVCIKKQIYSDEPWSDEDCITKDVEIVEWMEVSNLTAGAFYWFTVYSLNSMYNSTPANSSIIQTNDSTPDVVTNVTIKSFEFNTEVNFERPQRPYGKIVAYMINVRNSGNNSDCRVLFLKIPGYTGSVNESWKNCSRYPPTDISENQEKMFINVTKLLPDTCYSILIIALTNVGLGTPFNMTINTSDAVPGNVSNVTGDPINSTVIKVQWKAPEIRPGKTVYHVAVHDMILGTIVQNLTADGYEIHSLTVQGLKEYWIYQFEVYAKTLKGSSDGVISDNVTTEEAAPEVPIHLAVIYYNGSNCNATMVNFTWEDPALEHRNGKIVEYIIEITKGMVTTYQKNITDPDPYSEWSQTWWEILEILPEREYNLQVRAITETKKNGTAANTSFKSITCKPPPYDTSVVLIRSTEIKISSVTVYLHLGFFRNNGQGNITEYGLVVSDSKTADIDMKDLPNGRNGFPFKSRSSDLEKEVQNGAKYTNYAVENLPEDKTIYLMMYACTTAGCTTSEYYGPFRTFRTDNRDPGPNVAAIVVPIIVVLLMISVVSFMLYRKGYHVRILTVLRKSRPPQESVNFNHISEMNDNIIRKRPFKLSMLDEHLEEMNKDSKLGFAKEYEDIQKLSPKHSTEAALLGENKSKNRWVNILAFDHSRVKLQLLDEDDPTSDYINANFIPDLKRQRVYIATQGPLPGTIDDFWRMIWEHKVSIIVMLTKCKEGSRVKCEMYWPNELHEAMQYGDIVVKPISISNLDKFDINVFDVSMNEETRRVMHFHFQEFPDFSADVDFLTFVNFVKTVRQHSPHKMQGPIVVHCSAGVGRTGTYITVDCLQQLIDSPDFDFNTEVDIFDYVLTMRDHRTLMVQVEQQYIMIHECLRILLEQKKEAEVEAEERLEENLYENQAFALTRFTTPAEDAEGSNCSLTCPLIVSDDALAMFTTPAEEAEESNCSLTCPLIVPNNDHDSDEETDNLYENSSNVPRTEL